MVLRLLRLLRVLKLVKALPKLRILVIGLIKSFSAIAYIGMLLMLLFYLFAVLGVSLYGQNDPVHMGNLHIALISLFRAATGEDWTDLMYTAMFGCRGHAYDGMMHLCTDENNAEGGVVAALYWVVFLTFASLMILNLFIGVITGAMEDAKSELEAERLADAEADGEAQTSDTEESKDVDSSGDENQDVESAMPVRSPSMLRQMSQKLDQELEIKFNALAVIFREIADDIASMKQNEDMRVEEIRESRLGLTQASPGDGGTDSSGEVQQSSPLSAVSDLDELIKDTAGDGLDSL